MTKVTNKAIPTTEDTDEEEVDWMEMVPYGYGILEPGEWFWFAHRGPGLERERELNQEDTTTPAPTVDQSAVQPEIRINFRARK